VDIWKEDRICEMAGMQRLRSVRKDVVDVRKEDISSRMYAEITLCSEGSSMRDALAEITLCSERSFVSNGIAEIRLDL